MISKQKILLGTVMLITCWASGQNISAGLEGGVNLIPLTKSESGQDFRLGIHSGLKAQIQVKNNLSFTTGLNITQRKQFKQTVETSSLAESFGGLLSTLGGFSGDLDSTIQGLEQSGINTDVITTTNAHITMNQLELPLLFTYEHKNIQFHLGGYGAVLLTSKRRIEEVEEIPLLNAIDISTFDTTGLLSYFLPEGKSVDYSTNNDSDDLTKYDLGVMSGLSFTHNHLQMSIMYSQGLVKYVNTEIDERGFNSVLRFSLSYLVDFSKGDNELIVK